VSRQDRIRGSGPMAACIRRTGLARAARVRNRLPRGAFGERGDVPKDSMEGEAAQGAEASCHEVSGPCPPSVQSSGKTRIVGRGYGQQPGPLGPDVGPAPRAGEAESRLERRAWAARRALLDFHTHTFKADGTLVLHFRSPCSDIPGGCGLGRAPAGPCARKRYNSALRPLASVAACAATRRPGGPYGAREGTALDALNEVFGAARKRSYRLVRDGRCRAKPRNSHSPGRRAPRGGQRREARRGSRGTRRRASRRFTGSSGREH